MCVGIFVQPFEKFLPKFRTTWNLIVSLVGIWIGPIGISVDRPWLSRYLIAENSVINSYLTLYLHTFAKKGSFLSLEHGRTGTRIFGSSQRENSAAIRICHQPPRLRDFFVRIREVLAYYFSYSYQNLLFILFIYNQSSMLPQHFTCYRLVPIGR